MDKLAKDPQISAAWGRSRYGSYLNTFNPLSQLFGGVDRLPDWYVNMFPNTEGGQRAAHLTFHTGAAALLTAALVGGSRAIGHYSRMSELAKSDNPADKLVSNISTTFEGEMGHKKGQKKAATRNNTYDPTDTLGLPDTFSAANVFNTAIPLSAAVLAAALTYRKVDDYYDKKRNKALDESIAAKENAIKQIMTARARVAKANATNGEVNSALKAVNNDELYVKSAGVMDSIGNALDTVADYTVRPIQKGWNQFTNAANNAARTGVQGMGLLSSLVVLASAIGMYEYAGSRDENNVRYKALKKGLEEYTKNKSGYTPITIVPTDAKKYFDSIDNAGKAPAAKAKAPAAAVLAAATTPAPLSARQEPAALIEDYNKPISITL